MADSMFGPDGTADPPPPPLFPDPLAGLVTADLLAHPVEGVDVPRLRVAGPVPPDPKLAEAVAAAISERQPSAAELSRLPPPRARTGRYVPSSGATPRQVRKVGRAMGGRQPRGGAQPRQPASYAGQAAKPKRAGKTGAIVMFVLVLLVIVYNLFSDLASAVSGWFH